MKTEAKILQDGNHHKQELEQEAKAYEEEIMVDGKLKYD